MADLKGEVRVDPAIREKCGEGAASFEYDARGLSKDAEARLDSLVACFTSGPLKERTLNTIGYGDRGGRGPEATELGRARADQVANVLQKKGMMRDRLNVVSRAEEGDVPEPLRAPAGLIVEMTLVPETW